MNALYGKARQKFLEGSIAWLTDTIKAVLVDAADYAVAIDTHEFLADVPAAARIGTPQTLLFAGDAGTPPQIIDVAGIASAEGFGTAHVRLTAALAAIASAEAFGTAVAQLATAPSGIASAEAFGSGEAELVVAGAGIASGEAFGTPEVADAPLTVAPSGIASAESVGVAAVTAPVVEDEPSPASAPGGGWTVRTPSAPIPQRYFAAVVKVRGIPSAEAFGIPTAELLMWDEDLRLLGLELDLELV